VLPRRGIAGDGQSGVPVAGLDSGLALELVRGTRSPLGLRAGLDTGSGGVRDGAGGCARRSIAGVRSRGYWGVLQSKVASVKVRRCLGGAHRGCGTVGVAAQRDVGGEVDPRVAAVLVDGVAGVRLRAPDLHGSVRRQAVKEDRGLGRSGDHRRRGNTQAVVLT